MEDEDDLKGTHIMGLIIGTELLGSERGNIEALRALQSQGARISVVVSNRKPQGGDVGALCRTLGFNTLEIPFGSHFAKEWMTKDRKYAWRQIQRLFTNSWLLHRIIRKNRPDILLLGNTLAFAFVSLALTWHRVPLIFRVGDAPITNSRFQYFLWKRLAQRSTHIVAISQFILDSIAPLLNQNQSVTVIRNTPPHRAAPFNQNLYHTLLQSKKTFQIVFVGNITTQKGVKDLVQALINLNNPTIGCWILGGGEHSQKLEKELSDQISRAKMQEHIEMLGYTQDPRPYLKAADWLIAPSRENEALGNVVQEAKALGTPSLVTPVGGLPETVTHGITGWILDEIGSTAIQTTLTTLMTDGNNLSPSNILDEFEEHFSPTAFRSAWLQGAMQTLKAR